MHTRIALVTGASRGIGAAVAQQLAGPNTHVLVNYREKAKRANAVVDGIRAAGGQASALGADVSDAAATKAMIDRIDSRFGRLDMLVLNASGGLEFGAAPDYAMRLNRDAQLRLVDLALPMIVALAAEVLLMVVFSLLVVFPVMGHDYDAAMITAGFIGFGMGATSNAMANMQAVSRRYGPSPSAYFVIPMVGGLFNDFFNAAIIAFCIGLLA